MTRPRSKQFRVGAVAAAVAAAAVTLGAATPVGASRTSTDPATWKPWHLTSAAQLRLAPPPAAKSAITKKELAQILRVQRKRTAQMQEAIKKWVLQPTVMPWTDVFLQAVMSYRPRPPVASYNLAIFYSGLMDAMIAACDSRNAFAATSRPAPSKLDKRIVPAARVSGRSTYASPEAAIAGAAETLLPYLFVDAPASLFVKAATEAVNARLWAGLNYRSDLQRARQLGQRVAQAVIAKARQDGRATATGFPYPRLTGEPYWIPTAPAYEPPFGGPAGMWRPWLMTSNNQLFSVVPGPSKYGSPEYMAQLQAVLDTVANSGPEQRRIAFFWDDGPGTVTPPGHWVAIAKDLMKQAKTSNEQAVRVLAYVGAAEADAAVVSWGMKYFYWSVRPITGIWRLCGDGPRLCTEAEASANPTSAPYRGKWYSPITTPAFPSYPSGHATFSGAGSAVLAYFLPGSATRVRTMAAEAAQSRVYGGIHYPEDSRDGLILGEAVANLAIERAKADGGP